MFDKFFFRHYKRSNNDKQNTFNNSNVWNEKLKILADGCMKYSCIIIIRLLIAL